MQCLQRFPRVSGNMHSCGGGFVLVGAMAGYSGEALVFVGVAHSWGFQFLFLSSF